ncbi:MAG TPA: hypothetical protein VG267_13810 [Terracidiphilus sp.]|jgi:hypothetical protein|nr:hypothetical protein [Terracidiphilus sp.]
MRRSLPLVLLGLLSFSALLHADGPAFDLAGPKVDVHVKRGDSTLPIGEAANLMPGDRLWVHPDLPESQSAHFVLVVAFLRGATNPPPPDWFTRVETWTHSAREEGVFVTVPAEAQQALVFLAPETGGDFTTLRRAVHDRPGAFVRAAQDLQAASWERMRLDAYINEVKATSQADPKVLKERTEFAARSLGIRIQQQCFDRPPDQQAACLAQHTEGMVLDDANAQSLVSQIASGGTADLMNQLSYSSLGGAGMYSPYVGAIVDMAKILSSLHTAHFQYIPALALPTKDTLNLRLNEPPSFRDPKSVVVVALPPVGPSKPPPLHLLNPNETLCAQKPDLVFAADGAPMVFGTSIAHDLTLHIESANGAALDIPVTADPARGGLVPPDPLPALPAGELTAILHGKWGFDDFDGPHFKLLSDSLGKWTLAADDQSALIVGRNDLLHIQGDNTLCVSSVDLAEAKPLPLKWNSSKSGTLDVEMPMKDAAPGPVTIQIRQYGIEKPDIISVNAYAEAASLDRITLNVGDHTATLKGTRLDEVAKATFSNLNWTPDGLARVQDFDQLTLKTDRSTSDLDAGSHYSAKVALRDGRELKVPVHADPPRPQVTLLSKGSQDGDTAVPSPVHLGSPDDLPVDGKLVFFLKSVVPQKFPRNQNVEVAAEDGSFHTVLSLSDGSLMLEDTRTAIGMIEPLSRFGASAFGPLRARAVSADGVPGDWMPLGTLVRLPGLKELRCPRSSTKTCTLSGTNLFLVDSVASTQDFNNPTEVPSDFTGAQLTVPHPVNGTLYVKLRDDPDTVQTLTMPVTPIGLTPAALAERAAPSAVPAPQPPATPAAQPSPTQPSTPQSSAPQQPPAAASPSTTISAQKPASAPTKTEPKAERQTEQKVQH